jgi:hypothetical protein
VTRTPGVRIRDAIASASREALRRASRPVSAPVGPAAVGPTPRREPALREGDGADDQATFHPAAATTQPSLDGLPPLGRAPLTLTPVNHATGSI